jgi:hypothetical protein
VALVRTSILEDSIASIISVERIIKLGTTLTVTSTEARCKEAMAMTALCCLYFQGLFEHNQSHMIHNCCLSLP